jgi:hypothetical protein
LLLPIVLAAWLDYGLMAWRARRYLREVSAYLQEKERLEVVDERG